jgi:hypothetical protein
MRLSHTERALLCWSLERSLLQAEPEETEALELLLLRLSGSASPYAPFSSAELWRCAELSR